VEPNDRRETYQGFGDALARAFEMVVTPALFGLAGHFLDVWLGTRPWMMLTLALLAVVGMFARTWYSYDSTMKSREAQAPWSRRPEHRRFS